MKERHEIREQPHVALVVIRPPHVELEIGRAIRIEDPQRSRAGGRDEAEGGEASNSAARTSSQRRRLITAPSVLARLGPEHADLDQQPGEIVVPLLVQNQAILHFEHPHALNLKPPVRA